MQNVRRFAPRTFGTARASMGDMNASNTMTRKASELDVGSRVIVDGAIKTVEAIEDLYFSDRVITTVRFTDQTSTMERSGTFFTCLA